MRSHCRIIHAVLAVVLVFAAPALRADSCAAQSLSSVLGTSCTIGPLNFAFHNFTTSNQTEAGSLAGISANDIFFTPLTPAGAQGFRLDFSLEAHSQPPSDPSIIPADSSPVPNASSWQENYAQLFFAVNTTAPMIGIHQSISDSTASSSSSGGYSVAFTMDYTCNVTPECYEAYTGSEIGSSTGWSIYKTPTTFYHNFTHVNSWNLLYTYAQIGSSAYLTSATTLYTVVPDPHPLPEPGTFTLLGLAVMAFPIFRRK